MIDRAITSCQINCIRVMLRKECSDPYIAYDSPLMLLRSSGDDISTPATTSAMTFYLQTGLQLYQVSWSPSEPSLCAYLDSQIVS